MTQSPIPFPEEQAAHQQCLRVFQLSDELRRTFEALAAEMETGTMEILLSPSDRYSLKNGAYQISDAVSVLEQDFARLLSSIQPLIK